MKMLQGEAIRNGARYLLRNDRYWWRPDSNGYTADITAAGIYTAESARARARDGGNTYAVPLATVAPMLRQAMDAIRGLLAEAGGEDGDRSATEFPLARLSDGEF